MNYIFKRFWVSVFWLCCWMEWWTLLPVLDFQPFRRQPQPAASISTFGFHPCSAGRSACNMQRKFWKKWNFFLANNGMTPYRDLT